MEYVPTTYVEVGDRIQYSSPPGTAEYEAHIGEALGGKLTSLYDEGIVLSVKDDLVEFSGRFGIRERKIHQILAEPELIRQMRRSINPDLTK